MITVGPLISIIVAVYNIENFLEGCINSLICQTYKNIEIILVDDGSSDKSGEICDSFSEKDSRIKVIHKENGGLSDARNCGIDNCKGEYIIFIDGDDYVEDSFCKVLYQTAAENNADMAICSFSCVDEGGNPIEGLNAKNPMMERILTKDNFYRILLRNVNWCYIVAWNKIYRRRIWDKLRYPKGKIHEDEYMICDIINECDTIATTSLKLYNYVQRNGSITNKKFSEKRFDIFDALFHRIEFYLDNGIDDSVTASQTVAAIKLLCGFKDNTGNEYKKQYERIYKKLGKIEKRVLHLKMPIAYRAFIISNLISPKSGYLFWKLTGKKRDEKFKARDIEECRKRNS